MKKLFTLIILIMASTVILAESISLYRATWVAKNFITEKCEQIDGKEISLKLKYIETVKEKPVYYQFDIEDKGFIIISASNLTYPILAYSFESNFEDFPAVNALLGHYREQILHAENTGNAPHTKASLQWKHYSDENFEKSAAKSVVVGPLLTTKWDQNKFYNTYCPWDANSGSYYDYRVPNGCVALAAAQIMNYYRHPHSGSGGVSYVPYPYPRQTVIFSNHTYNWDAMCDEPQDYNGELAKIIYHVGVASEMGYNPDGSGTYTELAAEKMVTNFRYNEDYKAVYQGMYQDTLAVYYVRILKRELDSLRPILYSGYNEQMMGGHAFIIDGYDSEDLFHLNWGWGGSANGYFQIDHLSPGGSDFSYGARAILKLRPASNYPANCGGHKRNTASFGYITNGSTNKPYSPNPDCSWMVATPYATSYSFTFDRLSLNPDVDFVTIYNGHSENDGIAARFTGSTLPSSPVNVDADSVLITFTSTGTTEENTHYQGFLINYSTTLLPQTCSGITTFNTEVHSIITDGSAEDKNYRPQTNCTWMLRPTFVTGYAFVFRRFDLKKGDFVDIYDATTNPPTLWNRFDIYNYPPGVVFNCNFSKMRVNFVADNWEEGNGFEMEYYAILGLHNNSGLEDITLYPNPANEFISAKLSVLESDIIHFKIYDITGKLLFQEAVEHSGGELIRTFNTSSYSKGLYLIHIETKNGKDIRKFTLQ